MLIMAGTIKVDPHGDTPSYVQLADALRELIHAGEYGPREPIPSLSQLVGETGLAVNTVRKAIDVLVAEGRVYRVPGRGTFVSPRP